MLICAALVKDGISHISGVPYNDDIDATMDCLRALGVQMEERCEEQESTRTVIVQGCGGHFNGREPLNCRESGSTLRFMIPLCLLSNEPHELKGSTRLLQRPLEDYHGLLASRDWKQSANVLTIGKGDGLNGGVFSLEGKTSSQFVTGLLLVLPLLQENSTIMLSQAPESRSYIDMTIAALARFGISAYWQDEKTIAVEGGQRYTACDTTVDADASGAVFFHGLNALGGNVTIVNADTGNDILQGDSVCPQLLSRIVSDKREDIPVISLADCPDLGPILFAVAATKNGTLFTHCARLRLKESDRIAAMAA
jgi:3-phosphoshikimate 1-carboxyvinyltransferase